MAETNTNNLIPLGNWRDVGGGLTLAAVAGLFPTLFIFLGNWGKLHWSWKSAMGLAFIFGVPGLVAAPDLGMPGGESGGMLRRTARWSFGCVGAGRVRRRRATRPIGPLTPARSVGLKPANCGVAPARWL